MPRIPKRRKKKVTFSMGDMVRIHVLLYILAIITVYMVKKLENLIESTIVDLIITTGGKIKDLSTILGGKIKDLITILGGKIKDFFKPTDKESKGKPTDKESKGKPTDKESKGKPTDKESENEPTDKESENEPTDKESEGEPTDKESENEPTDGESEGESTDKESEGEPTDKESEGEPTDEEFVDFIEPTGEEFVDFFKPTGEEFVDFIPPTPRGETLVDLSTFIAKPHPFLNLMSGDCSSEYQLGFQDPATTTMEGIFLFNFHLLFIIIAIAIVVGWFIFSVLNNFTELDNSNSVKFTHSNEIEIVWTSIPALVLISLGIFIYFLQGFEYVNTPLILMVEFTTLVFTWQQSFMDFMFL